MSKALWPDLADRPHDDGLPKYGASLVGRQLLPPSTPAIFQAPPSLM